MTKQNIITKASTAYRTAGAGLLLTTLLLTSCGATTSTDTSATASTSTSSTATASASAEATTSSTASSSASTATTTGTTAETLTSAADAAQAFMDLLTDEQKEALVYDYNDSTKSTSWSNFPVTFVDRAGINLYDLTDEQKEAALTILEGVLNDEAYELAVNIMNGDQYLLDYSNTTEDSLGQYYIAFFGEPTADGTWSLQFGGHHLGLNVDLNGETQSITFAPTHLGSQPYSYTNENGETITTMDAIYTDAFAFYNSLTEEQLSTVYQGESVANLTCAPGDTCDFSTGTGLAGSELTDEQKELLLELIKNYAGMADDETWEAQKADILATIDDTYIAWSGATEYDTSIEGGIYFLISGPNVYLEFSGQGGSAGADVEGDITTGWGHVHSIYRDPSNDYGGSVEQNAASGMGGGAGAPAGGAPSGQAPQRHDSALRRT